MKKFFSTHKWRKIILLSVLLILVIGIIAFAIFASQTYAPDEVALQALQSDNVEIFKSKGIIAVYDDTPSDSAIMFYPGGQVEYEAYVPLLLKMQEELDMTCVMVEMPFNMAIFNKNAGDKIVKLFPEIENWHIVGHSIGGVTASMYAYDNQDIIKSLTVLGSFKYTDYPIDQTLTIYGSFNDNLEEDIDYTENIYVIEGGNHAMFGNYGRQRIDVDGTITTEEQQDQTVQIMKDFLNALQNK